MTRARTKPVIKPGDEPIDLKMAQEIMLGMIEGLDFLDEAQSAKRSIQAASDFASKISRGKQFNTIFEYFCKGLEQDPGGPVEEREFEQKKRTAVEVRTLHDRGLAPGYVEAAISYVACEFDFIATVAIVDYDCTGEVFEDLQGTLEPALKDAHKRLYKRSFELIRERKFVGVRPAHVFKMLVDGLNILEDVQDFVREYRSGQEQVEAGENEAAKAAWRNAGRALAHLSYLEERVPSKLSVTTYGDEDEEEVRSPTSVV